MQNEEQKLLLDIAIQNKEIIFRDNKTMAKVDFLKVWAKNPKVAENKDLKKLEHQIKELGIYKPILIALEKNNAVVLGGNQRLKVLQELAKKDESYQYIWVSLVEAPTDELKLKYALSDNEQIGKYTREKLREALGDFVNQPSMFEQYNLDLSSPQAMDKFIDELALTEQEIKLKQTKKDLKEMGVNEETIKALEQMVNYNKKESKLEDVDLKGEITGQKYPIMFWVDNVEDYELLKKIFDTGYKDKYNTEKLLELIKKYEV